MNKYLVLRFENAGLFTTNRNTKDYVFKSRKNGVHKRVDDQNFNFQEPITIYQISNLIHVLFGERPVPTFRDVFYKPLDYYYNKAGESFIKIDNYKKYNKNKNIHEYTNEIVQTKKALWNSYSKIVDINWFIIKKYLKKNNSDDILEYFISESNRIFNIDVRKISSEDLRKLYLLDDSKDKDNLIEYLNNNSKTAVSNYISKSKFDKSEITRNYLNNTIRTNNNGIDNVSYLNGSIYIPINDEDIQKLSKSSSGVCTLLDGGLVYIDSIKEEYEINNIDLIKVNNISTNKTVKNETENKIDKK